MAKILIVDDDPAIREILRAYLSREGYELGEAEDGVSALALAPTADLVVLDLMLPEMDGLEVARHLRRDLPDLPILMLTARGEEEERVRGFE